MQREWMAGVNPCEENMEAVSELWTEQHRYTYVK